MGTDYKASATKNKNFRSLSADFGYELTITIYCGKNNFSVSVNDGFFT